MPQVEGGAERLIHTLKSEIYHQIEVELAPQLVSFLFV